MDLHAPVQGATRRRVVVRHRPGLSEPLEFESASIDPLKHEEVADEFRAPT